MSTETQQEVSAHRIPRDTLARRVWMARDEAGLSQRAAAERCGLTFGEWQGIEAGRQSRGLDRKIALIAAGLGYDRDWLMWGGPLDPSQPRHSDGGESVNRRERTHSAAGLAA